MAVVTTERSSQPVGPLASGGAVMLAPGVDVLESERGGGVMLLAGDALWLWAVRCCVRPVVGGGGHRQGRRGVAAAGRWGWSVPGFSDT